MFVLLLLVSRVCQRLLRCDFHEHYKSDECQILYDGSTHWTLPIHGTFSIVTLIVFQGHSIVKEFLYDWIDTVQVLIASSGGEGLFHACEDFGRMFDNSFPACAVCFFFHEVEICLRKLIALFRPGSVHSGLASWDDCDWVFPDGVACELISL